MLLQKGLGVVERLVGSIGIVLNSVRLSPNPVDHD